MKALRATCGLALPLVVALAACTVHVDHDPKTGDVTNVDVSLAGLHIEHGNGVMKTQTRTVSAFNTIESSGAVDVQVAVGAAPSLVVEGDENLLSHVRTNQQGSTLSIDTDGMLSTGKTLTVRLTTPSLARLHHAGSGDVKVTGLGGGDLRLDSAGSGDTSLTGRLGKLDANLTGSGDLDAAALSATDVSVAILGSGDAKFGHVDAGRFAATVRGSGDVSAAGRVKSVSADVFGSGSLMLEDLKADSAVLHVMGSGDIVARATQSLEASAGGSGDITVHGNPPERKVSGENVTVED